VLGALRKGAKLCLHALGNTPRSYLNALGLHLALVYGTLLVESV
jgi:hypothetical protein